MDVESEQIGELPGEGVDDQPGEDRAGGVVQQAAAAGPLARPQARLAVQPQRVMVDDDLHDVVGHSLSIPHGRGQYLRHHQPSFDLGDLGRLRSAGADAGVEVADGRQQDPGLTERGQHLPDVPHEGRVRADDQHDLLGQTLPVGVKQIRGAVQGYRGLAGARSTLDDQDTPMIGTDDPVLFALDGLDDVAHAPGPFGAERGQ